MEKFKSLKEALEAVDTCKNLLSALKDFDSLLEKFHGPIFQGFDSPIIQLQQLCQAITLEACMYKNTMNMQKYNDELSRILLDYLNTNEND